MPYLIGPNSAAIDAEQNSATNSTGTECSQKPTTASAGGADLGELQAPRDDRLVEAVGQLAAEAGEEEERADEHRAGERDQRLGVRARRP